MKISQPVIVPGSAKRALIYIGRSGDPGRPKPGYMEAVIAGAKHFDLPETYVTGLNRFLTKPKLDLKGLNQDANAPLPPGPVKGVRPRALAPK